MVKKQTKETTYEYNGVKTWTLGDLYNLYLKGFEHGQMSGNSGTPAMTLNQFIECLNRNHW
jgi:hypothetical protein